MTPAITDQFKKTGRILTTNEHSERIIKEIRRNYPEPIAVSLYECGAVVIRKTHALIHSLSE